jgi:hypothetical protein
VAVDRLITTSQLVVRFLRQSASYASAAELPALATSLVRASDALDAAIREALAAPADESGPRESSWLDAIIEQLRDPRAMPTRFQVLWSLAMLRRARSLIRRYLAAAEITEGADSIAEGQRWLDDVAGGPTTP